MAWCVWCVVEREGTGRNGNGTGRLHVCRSSHVCGGGRTQKACEAGKVGGGVGVWLVCAGLGGGSAEKAQTGQCAGIWGQVKEW